MTGNKVTGMLAAAAIALGMITMGCVEEQSASILENGAGKFKIDIEGQPIVDEDGFIQEPELWNEGNPALDANALTANDNTMPNQHDVLGDLDLDVNLPTIPAKVENLLLDSKTLEVIGYVEYESMQYVFDNGLLLDPDQIVDIDEADVMIPESCDEDECTEDGDGHYPHDGELLEATRPGVLGTVIKRAYPDGDVEPEANWEEAGMYVEPEGQNWVLCKLICEHVPHPACVEVCQPYRP